MVAIIDYGMGNVASVQKALSFLKLESIITNSHDEINNSKFIILPGVGAFAQGMANLTNSGLKDILTEQALTKKKPIFGICMGMQLFATKGTENYDCDGLGWIDGEVIKIEAENRKIPHLGWNNIDIKNPTYMDNLTGNDFYFIHSYHFKVSDEKHIAATVDYGGTLVAAVQKENLFATQFHPEKSQEAGLKILKTFFETNA